MTAAKDVCGEQTKTVQNSWMMGKDKQIQRMRSRLVEEFQGGTISESA